MHFLVAVSEYMINTLLQDSSEEEEAPKKINQKTPAVPQKTPVKAASKPAQKKAESSSEVRISSSAFYRTNCIKSLIYYYFRIHRRRRRNLPKNQLPQNQHLPKRHLQNRQKKAAAKIPPMKKRHPRSQPLKLL